MKIYHGTAMKFTKEILAEGIQPRSVSKMESNWEDYPSHSGMVYLSTAYPFYFALTHSAKSRKVVTFEVDLDKLDKRKLYPDEDFISQSCRDVPNHEYYRNNLSKYQQFWSDSLAGIGNVAYKGTIKREWITRYCVFDLKARPHLAMDFLDPTITILNYRFLAWRYLGLVKWMFGDVELLPQITSANPMNVLREDGMPGHREHFMKESKDRTGIKVFKC